MHSLFTDTISQYAVREDLIQPIVHELEKAYYVTSKDMIDKEQNYNSRLVEIKKGIETLDEKYYVTEDITKEKYEMLSYKLEKEKTQILNELGNFTGSISNLDKKLNDAINLCQHLNRIWVEGEFASKDCLQKLIFPDGLAYDKKIGAFLTPKPNAVISEIARVSGDLSIKEKGLKTPKSNKSLLAEKEGFEPSVRLPVRMFSKHVLSASQASLQLYYLK